MALVTRKLHTFGEADGTQPVPRHACIHAGSRAARCNRSRRTSSVPRSGASWPRKRPQARAFGQGGAARAPTPTAHDLAVDAADGRAAEIEQYVASEGLRQKVARMGRRRGGGATMKFGGAK